MSNPPGNYASILFDELTSAARSDKEKWSRVEQLCAEGEEESLHLDFKALRGPSPDPAKDLYVIEKFARALSGFSNVAGGLLIYGINTNGAPKGAPDTARDVVEIPDVGAFRAALEKLASLVVEPTVAGLDIRHVVNPSNPDSGVVVVHVPQSQGGPHRVVTSKVPAEDKDRYFMRTTTEIVVMPHALLADRFNRSASPRLQLQVAIINISPFMVEFRLFNHGRGAARRPAMIFREAGRAPKIVQYPAFDRAMTNGFILRANYSRSKPDRMLLEPIQDVVIYPGADLRVLQGSNASLGAVLREEHSFRIEAELHALDAQPVSGDGAIEIGYCEDASTTLARRIVIGDD